MTQSLQGLHVLNTRPLEQGKALSRAIEEAGGIAIECPALAIESNDSSWLLSLSDLTKIDQAIFISANAVNCCFMALKQHNLVWPTTIKIIAVGQGTANALCKHEIRVDLIPEIADSEHLLELEAMQQVNQQHIILFKGEGGRTLITETLKARGANLIVIELYKRVMPNLSRQYLLSLWHQDAVDIILFTSQQAMENIFVLFGENAYAWLCTKPCVVISERLAKSASLLGMQTILISSPETILNTLHQFNEGLIHGQ